MANKLSSECLVDGAQIYEPARDVTIQHENVAGSSSGRTEDGIMHIDWVRTDVRKVGITYKELSISELNFMVGKLQGKEFTFTFPDRGKKTTINAYCSNCSYTMRSYDMYVNVKFNIIER